MKQLLVFCLIAGVCSCNSSGKKNPGHAMDDTARAATYQPGAPITPVNITEADIPKVIEFKGKLQEAWKWMDNHGENFLVTSYVAPYDDTRKNEHGEEGQTSELHAYHFATKKKGLYEVWSMEDGVYGCPFDITSNFIPGSTTITDLDKNGVAEIKLQYFSACRSDVSPAVYKLVLFENGKRHSLKGFSWLPYTSGLKFEVTPENANLEKVGKPNIDNDEDYILTFGRYENEKEFTGASPAFLVYARSEWVKFAKEKIGE